MNVLFSADPGEMLKDGIIALAEKLTLSESAPGYFAGLFLGVTIAAGASYWWRTSKQIRAIKEFDQRVRAYRDSEKFAEGYDVFKEALKNDFAANDSRKALQRAFSEFNETVVQDVAEDRPTLRNSIRPANFLNIEDLEFGPSIYRILPNFFVSAGLLATFMGLVAALHQFSQSMNNGSGGMDQAMQGFMTIASAKFVMSLVGLFCSIVFTVLLRFRQNKLEAQLNRLNSGIESRLVFVSLEEIGFRQLKAAVEQRDHLRQIGMEMVSELSKPLNALPEHITGAIAKEMDPIFKKVSSLGTSNMEGMVGDLSKQLSHSVGNALTRASESLSEATDRIGLMVDRMDGSQVQAGNGLRDAIDQISRAMSEMRSEVAASGRSATEAMNSGADRLLTVMNDTLNGIRENTGQGATAMRTAAEEMRSAAEGFRDTLVNASETSAEAARVRIAASSEEAGQAITGAGRSLLDSFKLTSDNIAKLGHEMSGVIGDELMARLEGVVDRLSDLANAVQQGASGAQRAADGMNSGADAINGASVGFRSASQALTTAFEPIRASHERVELSLKRVGELVETVSETLMQNSASVAENAAYVLETAQAALGTEREGIRRNLEATRAAMAQLSQEAEKLDQIDTMLGRALVQYSSQLEAALGSAQDHIDQMNTKLQPGLDTLSSVISQAEQFIPQSRGRV